MNADEFDRLNAAQDLVRYAADCDPYCEDKTCTVDSPKCREHHLLKAVRAIEALLEPAHEGFHPRRLRYDGPGVNAERIYTDEWKKENTRQPWLNSGYTAIEHILHPEAVADEQRKRGWLGSIRPERVNFRDAGVAATVIQWLGTNCGLAFIEKCERRITQERAMRASWPYPVTRLPEPEPKTKYRAQAEVLAGRLYGTDRYNDGIRTLQAALEAAFASGKAQAMVEAAAAAEAKVTNGDQR